MLRFTYIYIWLQITYAANCGAIKYLEALRSLVDLIGGYMRTEIARRLHSPKCVVLIPPSGAALS